MNENKTKSEPKATNASKTSPPSDSATDKASLRFAEETQFILAVKQSLGYLN
jgi:hypothetical protein